MSFRLKETDCQILESMADYRILTVTQLAVLLQKSRPVIRKRLRDFEKEELVEVVGHGYGQGRGRPESSFGLTSRGVDALRSKHRMAETVPNEKIVADCLLCVDHQSLLNWFRIHLAHIQRGLPQMTVRFLAHNSPYLPQGPDGPISISDCSPVPGRGIQEVKFTPDAVFATCDVSQAKTCLFFLEVDCGTETLADPKRGVSDIRQKIINYQFYFRSARYKRYEQLFHCTLRGFRLLFLTHSLGRLTALCQLVQEMPPSNFIWLTECGRLFADGASASIWAKGGDLRGPQQSILGSLCCRAPLVYRDDSKCDNVSA